MNSLRKFLKLMVPHANLLVFLSASAILGTAYIFQYGFDYQPCDLCYTQRYPYMAVIALSGLAVLGEAGAVRLTRSVLELILGLCALLLFLDAGIAGYHAGVEYGWWQGPTACTSLVELSGSLEDQLKQLMSAPLIRCDVPAWTLFGISMAGYNFFLALGLGLFAGHAWRARQS